MKVVVHYRIVKRVHRPNKNNMVESNNQKNVDSTNAHILAIRLCYVEMHENYIGHYAYPVLKTKYGISSPFVIPKMMTLEQAQQVVSYLMDKAKKDNRYKKGSIECVEATSKMLQDYGFNQRINPVFKTEIKNTQLSRSKKMYTGFKSEAFTKDMFVVNGNVRLFDQTDLKDKFYSWYSPTTRDQIKSIYKDIDKENVFYKAECKHSKINQRSNEKTLQK